MKKDSQNPRDAVGVYFLMFGRVYVCVGGCVTPSGQAKNDRDLKFGTRSQLYHISKPFARFFLKKWIVMNIEILNF